VALVNDIDDYSHMTALSNPLRDEKAISELFYEQDIDFAEYINLDCAFSGIRSDDPWFLRASLIAGLLNRLL